MTGCPAVLGVLLPGGERAGGGVGDRVEREPEREPGDDERDAGAEPGRRVEDAGGEEDRGEAGDERELREPEQADPDHLAGEQVARPNRREDDLDDAVVLLLDHAGDHPLAVDGERHEQEQRADVRDEGLRRRWSSSPADGALPSSAPVPGGRWLRSARTAVSAIAAAFGVDVRAEDEPVLRQEQERVDLLGVECSPPGCRRGDHAQPHLRVVERLRRALERGGEAGRRRRRRPRRGRSARSRAPRAARVEPPTSRSMISVETRNTLLRRRSRISRRATSVIARRPLTAPPAPGTARRARAARS